MNTDPNIFLYLICDKSDSSNQLEKMNYSINGVMGKYQVESLPQSKQWLKDLSIKK